MRCKRIGVDETSFQKRHEYVTVVNDLDGHVLHVADGRGKESLEEFYKQFDREQLAGIKTMDMWEPYPRDHPVRGGRAEKIAFDKFHVAGHLGDAVDRVGAPSIPAGRRRRSAAKRQTDG